MKTLDRGLFIVLEGADGTGKTTQAGLLHKHLIQEGYDAILTREPGGTRIGNILRDIMLYEDISRPTELFLYMADRAENVNKIIKPLLDENKIVICDRYYISTLIYQGLIRGWMFETLMSLHVLCTQHLYPDVNIILHNDTPLKMDDDKWDSAGIEFHNKIREGYRGIKDFFIRGSFEDTPTVKPFCIYGGVEDIEVYAKSKEQVHEEIKEIINAYLENKIKQD